jgi:hypothetical protein
MFIRWGKETWKRGNGGGEYEGVDEGKMEGLHSLLHTVGFFFYFPFQVPSALFTKPTDSTRERERERQRERESRRHRERGRGKASALACVRAASEHLVSVPASTLTAGKGVGDEREFIGPLLSADGCAHAHTRTPALMPCKCESSLRVLPRIVYKISY